MKVKYTGVTNGFLTHGNEYEVDTLGMRSDIGIHAQWKISEFSIVKKSKQKIQVGDMVRFKNKHAGFLHGGSFYKVTKVNPEDKTIKIEVVIGENTYPSWYYAKYFRLVKETQ